MHVAFLSADKVGAEAFDRDTAMIGAFQALGLDVTVIAPHQPPVLRADRLRAGLVRRLGYNVSIECSVSRLRRLAGSIEKELVGTKADVIFSRSTHFTAWLETSLPVVNYVDAVFDCIVDFYPAYTHLDFLSLRAGHRAERRALSRSSLTVLMSLWAAERASRCYSVPETRLGVVQAPAILPSAPTRAEVLSARSRAPGVLRCLIVGSDWLRKGADIALEAVRRARIMGADVRLTTLGMKVPAGLSSEPWLESLPPLQKGRPQEYAQLQKIFIDSDIFLLPSRADFSPHVIAEAYAFGLPAIVSSVGAVPEMIEFGQTGFVSQRVDDADEYARILLRLATEPGQLAHMAIESRNKYEAEYALPVAARKLVAHLESVLYRSGKR